MPRHLRRASIFLFVFSMVVLSALPAITSQSPADSQGDGIAVTDVTAFPVDSPTGVYLEYGINVSLPYADDHLNWASELGMHWIKVYDAADDPPFKVLRRIPANWEDYDDLDAYCSRAQSYVSPHIDAYEIGNEPNLDWSWSEGARSIEVPNAYEYTQVLQTAYTCIKALQPDAIVVSSGMATVGPYDKDTDPPAYPHAWNDLRFLQAMYDYGAKGYFDALGSHPHGFAYSPEQDPAAVNGLAFRRIEQQRAVMAANGDGDKQVWATEWGWLLREEACRSEWETQGRWWQAVDEATQADYIRRAFEYAERHWPWMGPMFLFNLDFNMVGWYAPCDAMRYYAIRNTDGTPRKAYETLRDMPKWPYAVLIPQSIKMLLDHGEMTSAYTQTVHVKLIGAEPLTYTTSTDASWLTLPTGVHTGSGIITLTINTADFVADMTYAAPVTVTIATGLGYVHRHLDVTILVAGEVFHVYLPALLKSFQTSVPPTPTPTPATPTPTTMPTTTATATPAFTPTPEVCDEGIVNGGFEFDGDWEIPSTGYPAAYTTAASHSGNRSMCVGIVEPGDNRASYSSARQLVTLPAGAVGAMLRFWLYPMSHWSPWSSGPSPWSFDPGTKGTEGFGPGTLGPSALVLNDKYRAQGRRAKGGEPERPVATTIQEAALSGDAQYVLILDENDRWIDTLLWQRTNPWSFGTCPERQVQGPRTKGDDQWTFHQFDLMAYAGQTIKLHFGVYNDGWGRVTGMYLDDVSLEVCSAGLPPTICQIVLHNSAKVGRFAKSSNAIARE